MLLYITIFIVLAIGFMYKLHYSVYGGRKGKLIDKIPGPYITPFIGNNLQFMLPPDKLWNWSLAMFKRYYPINRFWRGRSPTVTIYHPDDVKALLSSTKHIDKGRIYQFLHPWLGSGLLTSSGTKWYKRRKIFTPAFHFNVLEQFVGVFIEQSNKLTESLCLNGDEVVPDLVFLLHKYTLNSICGKYQTSGRWVQLYALAQETGSEQNSSSRCLRLSWAMRPWLYPDLIFRFFKKYKEQVRVLKVLHGFSTNIIKERKRYHEETHGRHLKGLGPDGGSDSHVGNGAHVPGKRRLAVLDLLIAAEVREASIDDEGIREEVDTFIFKGHDTTAMILCFALLLLAENKEIQDEARVEVDAIFEGKAESELSLRELQSMVYLERCMKESLRLFPSVPMIYRYISKDLQLKNYVIPAGTNMAVHIYTLHRDPNFWSEPDVFNPDRFLPDQVKARHPYAFIPFSAGLRNCIGKKFALLEMKALVATFLRNFYLQPIDLTSKVRMRSDMVLRTMNPLRIKLVRRSRGDTRNFSQANVDETTLQ